MSEERLAGLLKLREPFPASQIGKLPKGGIMLDFVGHGFITARLLDADPAWDWEPMAKDSNGLPLFDENGGLWIYLTVCGVTRKGYGDAGGRKGPNAIKEAIGDALRNAGMRFGLALDLWCKGDPDAPEPVSKEAKEQAAKIDAANIARGEMLEILKVYGWTPQKLLARFKDDYNSDLRSADAKTVKAFSDILEEEAKDQIKREEENSAD
jgi:hypothetical protein